MEGIVLKIVRICNCQFKCSYLKNKKSVLNFLLHFWSLYQILDILKKRMIVIADVFPKLGTVKVLVRPLSKKHPLRTRIRSQHMKASQILPKSP